MSRFYNNNQTIAHSRVYFNQNTNNNITASNISQCKIAGLNKSNVSMTSQKML